MALEKFKKWLDKMAKSNEVQFGKGRELEYCFMNQCQQNISAHVSAKNK